MKRTPALGLPGLAAILLLPLLTACQTPRIDWNARIGSYTYDQAVLELGPPERVATLSEGTMVAEWLTYRGTAAHSYHVVPVTRFGPMHYAPMHYVYDPGFPDQYLRLTFSPDGLLRSWQRVAR